MRTIKFLNKVSILILFIFASGFVFQVKAVPGDLDTTFGTGGVYTDTIPITTTGTAQTTSFTDSKLLADGSLISFGTYSDYAVQNYDSYSGDFYLQKLTPNGTLDPTFGTGGTKRIHLWDGRSYSTKMKILPDNKILVAGRCFIVTGFNTPIVRTSGFGLCAMQLMPDGSLDTSFGGNQITVYSATYNVPDSSYTMPPGTACYDSNGGNDGNPEGAYAVDTTPSGDIVLAGRATVKINPPTNNNNNYYAEVLRLSSSGALISRARVSDAIDPAGSARFARQFNAIGVLSDGKVIAVGYSENVADEFGYPSRFLMARIAIDGSVETTYENSEVNAQAGALSVTFTRSNKILVGGYFGYFGGNRANYPRLYRFNGDFTPDTTFGTNGIVSYCLPGNGCPDKYASYYGAQTIIVAAIQPDGKILALTESYNPNSGSNTIARLNPDGSFDRSFGNSTDSNILFHGYEQIYNPTGGHSATSVNVRPNGKIVTAGQIYNQSKASVAQFLNTSKSGTYSDFDNDGKSDVSVFRSGTWYYLNSFNNAFSGATFGQAGDKPVPADYDGDGKTDLAVYRGGIWYLQQSTKGFLGIAFGAAGDIPVPGDFNGDGQADIAVFRPSTGTWYILYSNPIQPGNITTTAVQFGQAGDVPLLADFDGDGKSDVAVYRAGTWYYLRSSDGGFRGVSFGTSTDVPVVGDYDADSKSDVAVFRPSNGYWYRLTSSNGAVLATLFGQTGDRPVPGDYDNDGKNDLAVFRNGTWYELRSSDNSVAGVSFGAPTDTPVPAAYLP
ncbi:MAG: FG-GAP-like repeat-containing protein [Pyrinomonadaceae bacterium]